MGKATDDGVRRQEESNANSFRERLATLAAEGVEVDFMRIVIDRMERMTVAVEAIAANYKTHLPREVPEPAPESKRLTPVEKAQLIQVACQMLPDWKANTSAIARELGIGRKTLERSKVYRRARAIECSLNPDDYRE